jgi:hypothetical protein
MLLRTSMSGNIIATRRVDPSGNCGTPVEEGEIWNVVVYAAALKTAGPPFGSCVAKFQQTTTL